MEKGNTLSIRQAENGVIVFPESPDTNCVAIREEYVFDSFKNLDRHLRSWFKMPTIATLSDEPHNVGCGAMR